MAPHFAVIIHIPVRFHNARCGVAAGGLEEMGNLVNHDVRQKKWLEEMHVHLPDTTKEDGGMNSFVWHRVSDRAAMVSGWGIHFQLYDNEAVSAFPAGKRAAMPGDP